MEHSEYSRKNLRKMVIRSGSSNANASRLKMSGSEERQPRAHEGHESNRSLDLPSSGGARSLQESEFGSLSHGGGGVAESVRKSATRRYAREDSLRELKRSASRRDWI